MDVSLYYDFECIVRYGSISEAAKHLHISQPALSRRVTSIEQEVGMELFERTTPIQLTMAGEIFLEYACRINAEQYKLSTQMNRLRTTPVTVLHVAGLYSKKIGRAVRSVKNQIETDTLFIDIKQETNLYREPSVDLLRKGKLQLSIEPFCPDLNMEGLDSTPLCEEDIYAVFINKPEMNDPHEKNKIETSKYKWFNFLAKILMEQFSRLANAYFLVIAVLQSIKALSYSGGAPLMLIPLAFVVCLNGIKDIYEDFKRKKSDKKENNTQCLIYNPMSHQFEKRKWHEIRLGDIIKVENNQQFPADLLLLSTSDENGIS